MIRPYEGSDPYVFVSYSHADEASVVPIVELLQMVGYRVWYDAGIEGGSVFTTRIGLHVDSCEGMVAFLSPAYAESWWCQDEVQLAYEQHKHVLPVVMEDVELVDPLRFYLRRFHREWRKNYGSNAEFVRALMQAPFMAACLRRPVRDARRALASPVADEGNLQQALSDLRSLPPADRDEGVVRLEEQLRDSLHSLESERMVRAKRRAAEQAEFERRRQEEERSKALAAARVTLSMPQWDERSLQSSLSELRALPDTEGDREVRSCISSIQERLDVLEAERARQADEARRAEEAKRAARQAEIAREERERVRRAEEERKAAEERKAEEARLSAESAEREGGFLSRREATDSDEAASSTDTCKRSVRDVIINVMVIVACAAIVLAAIVLIVNSMG